MTTEIRITRFDPLRIDWGDCADTVTGEVRIYLPPVTVLVVDDPLGLGAMLGKSMKVTSQHDGWHYKVHFSDPIERANLAEVIEAEQGTFCQLHQELQKHCMSKPLVQDNKELAGKLTLIALANSGW